MIQCVSHLLVTLLGFLIHENIGFNIFGVGLWAFFLSVYPSISILKTGKMSLMSGHARFCWFCFCVGKLENKAK